MREDIALRCLKLARRVAEGATVRQAAKAEGVSKSLAHRELTQRLRTLDTELYLLARAQLNYHKAVRHLRGGEATRRRFRGE